MVTIWVESLEALHFSNFLYAPFILNNYLRYNFILFKNCCLGWGFQIALKFLDEDIYIGDYGLTLFGMQNTDLFWLEQISWLRKRAKTEKMRWLTTKIAVTSCWKLLNVTTLGQMETDNINRMITRCFYIIMNSKCINVAFKIWLQ